MISHVKFVSIPVKDQDLALDFYVTKLGFKVATDQAFGSQRWIELRIPRAETRVVLFTPEGHEARIGTFSGVSFSCDDVRETFEEMKARGVTFTQGPKTESWGTSALFQDLDGNAFVLSSN